jgi:signal peptidase I
MDPGSKTGDGGWGSRGRALTEVATIFAVAVGVALFLRLFVVEAYRIPTSSMEDTLLPGDNLLVNKIVYGARTPRYVAFLDGPLPQLTLPALQSPARGDVVVFESPVWRTDPAAKMMNLVKRCIGLPGDTVQIVNRVVLVNGIPFPDPEQASRVKLVPLPPHYQDPRIYPAGAPYNADDYGPVTVPYAGLTLDLSAATIDTWREVITREGHAVAVRYGMVLIDGEEAREYRIGQDYYFVMGDNRRNSLDSRYWGFVPASLMIGKAMVVYWSYDTEGKGGSFMDRIRWNRIGMVIR